MSIQQILENTQIINESEKIMFSINKFIKGEQYIIDNIDFLSMLKEVQENGDTTKRQREWIEKVEHITAKDLAFIVD